MLNRKLNEYDLIRIFATITVVVGHSAYMAMYSAVGGVNYSTYTTGYEIFSSVQFFNFIASWVYRFHMPLFFILSGAVFAKTINKSSSQSTFVFTKKKAVRLLIPYFTYGVAFMFIVKYIGDFYNKDTIMPATFNFFTLNGDSGHLWFLTSLFFTSVLFFAMFKLINKFSAKLTPWVLLLLSFVVLYIYNILKVNPIIVRLNLSYIVYYALGFLFEATIKEHIAKLNNVTKFIIFILLVSLSVFDLHRYLLKPAIFSSIMFLTLFLFSNLVIQFKKVESSAILTLLSLSSMTVYILHDPLEYIVLKYYLPLVEPNSQITWLVFYLLRTVGIFIISIVYYLVYTKIKTKLVKKEKQIA